MSETAEDSQFVCTACGEELAAAEPAGCPECQGTVVPMGVDVEVGPGRILGGRYVLLEALGRGAMGAVFLAKQRTLDKRVAVKVMALGLGDKHALRRFYSEAQNAAQLEHPHNVKVFDFGHDQGDLAYLVMEVVRGRPLSKVLMPMPVPRAVRIGAQVCRALIEAHDRGLVHRDLKPDNVMLTELDGEDFARVLDYGIAKAMNGAGTVLTRTGMMIGTPRYISPEQAQGEEIDARSDIYSFGAMLFELLTGRPPFEEANAIALALAHIGKPAPRPSTLTALPEPLDALIVSCLAKNRDERPQSMRAILETLRALLGVPGGSLLTGEHDRETRQGPAMSGWMSVGPAVAAAAAAPSVEAPRAGTEVVRGPEAAPELWPRRSSWRQKGLLAAVLFAIVGLIGAALVGGSPDESSAAAAGADTGEPKDTFELWPAQPATAPPAYIPTIVLRNNDGAAQLVEPAAKPIFEIWPSAEPATDEASAAPESEEPAAAPADDNEVADRSEQPSRTTTRDDNDDDDDHAERRGRHRGRSGRTRTDRQPEPRQTEEPSSGPRQSNPDVINEIERGIRRIFR